MNQSLLLVGMQPAHENMALTPDEKERLLSVTSATVDAGSWHPHSSRDPAFRPPEKESTEMSWEQNSRDISSVLIFPRFKRWNRVLDLASSPSETIAQFVTADVLKEMAHH